MATRESLAIREERARNRMRAAAETLSAQLGKRIEPIEVHERDPYTRQAVLAERTADLLESLIAVESKPVDAGSDTSEQKAETDGDHTTSSGRSATQQTQESGERSKAKPKRR